MYFYFRDSIQLFESKHICHFHKVSVKEPSKHCYLFVNGLGKFCWNIIIRILVHGMGKISQVMFFPNPFNGGFPPGRIFVTSL